jgi:hypothetical protein
MLAFDSGPPLRLEGLAKERRSLLTPLRLFDRKAWPTTLLTLTCVSDRGCTEPLLMALFRLAQLESIGTNRPGMPTR